MMIQISCVAHEVTLKPADAHRDVISADYSVVNRILGAYFSRACMLCGSYRA